MFFSWNEYDPLITNQHISFFSVPKTTPRSFYSINAKTTDSGIHISICLYFLNDIDE